MNKTFTCALLISAAFAKGNDTGLDEANAKTTNLVKTADVELDLNTWATGDKNAQEFLADLTLSLPGAAKYKWIRYGACFATNEAADQWDCVDAQGTYGGSETDITLTDKQYAGKASDFKAWSLKDDDEAAPDGKTLSDADKWALVADKSTQDCTASGSDKVKCASVNVQVKRSFSTL